MDQSRMDEDDSENKATEVDESIETRKRLIHSLVEKFSEADRKRHELYKRSHFDRAVVKRCMTDVAHEYCQQRNRSLTISQPMTIVMAGTAKMFVGDIMTEARRLMDWQGESGQIRPKYIKEAYRVYRKRRGAYSRSSSNKRSIFHS